MNSILSQLKYDNLHELHKYLHIKSGKWPSERATKSQARQSFTHDRQGQKIWHLWAKVAQNTDGLTLSSKSRDQETSLSCIFYKACWSSDQHSPSPASMLSWRKSVDQSQQEISFSSLWKASKHWHCHISLHFARKPGVTWRGIR